MGVFMHLEDDPGFSGSIDGGCHRSDPDWLSIATTSN
jgi:hypothetical protein